MAISFYFARLLGSPNHLISAFLGAISTTTVLLNLDKHTGKDFRYASQCDRFGNPYVTAQDTVVQTVEEDYKGYSKKVLRKFNDLYTRM